MDGISAGNDPDAEPMSTDILQDILDGSQYHPIINRIEARYKILYCIKQGQAECK